MNSCLTSGRGVVYAAGAHKQFKLVSSSSLSQKISYFQANTLQSVAEFYCGVATRRVACCSAHSATRSQSNSHKGPGLGETCFLGNQKPILSCRLYAKYSPSSKGCVASVSCNSAQSPAEHASTSAPPNGSGSSSSNGENLTNHYPPTYVKAEGRVIAIGDLHGDLTKTLQSLELAGVLGRDDTGRPTWVGGNTVVVQIGDVLDRGDCEIGIIMLLRQLHKMAQIEGGAVYMLNGNHESLNVCGDYRCEFFFAVSWYCHVGLFLFLILHFLGIFFSPCCSALTRMATSGLIPVRLQICNSGRVPGGCHGCWSQRRAGTDLGEPAPGSGATLFTRC